MYDETRKKITPPKSYRFRFSVAVVVVVFLGISDDDFALD